MGHFWGYLKLKKKKHIKRLSSITQFKIEFLVENCLEKCLQRDFENTGLESSRASLTSWREGASLALVGHPSSDGITIKMPYGVDVLHRPASHPIFSYWVG